MCVADRRTTTCCVIKNKEFKSVSLVNINTILAALNALRLIREWCIIVHSK
jgi:hypothetical protein